MNTYIVRETKYDSRRPYEVVCIGSKGSILIMSRYASRKAAVRRCAVLAGRA
jgi:hypothetical protein